MHDGGVHHPSPSTIGVSAEAINSKRDIDDHTGAGFFILDSKGWLAGADSKNIWQSFGGDRDGTESPWQTATRELHEETGLLATDLTVLAPPFTVRKHHHVYVLHIAQINSGSTKHPVPSRELTRFKHFTSFNDQFRSELCNGELVHRRDIDKSFLLIAADTYRAICMRAEAAPTLQAMSPDQDGGASAKRPSVDNNAVLDVNDTARSERFARARQRLLAKTLVHDTFTQATRARTASAASSTTSVEPSTIPLHQANFNGAQSSVASVQDEQSQSVSSGNPSGAPSRSSALVLASQPTEIDANASSNEIPAEESKLDQRPARGDPSVRPGIKVGAQSEEHIDSLGNPTGAPGLLSASSTLPSNSDEDCGSALKISPSNPRSSALSSPGVSFVDHPDADAEGSVRARMLFNPVAWGSSQPQDEDASNIAGKRGSSQAATLPPLKAARHLQPADAMPTSVAPYSVPKTVSRETIIPSPPSGELKSDLHFVTIPLFA